MAAQLEVGGSIPVGLNSPSHCQEWPVATSPTAIDLEPDLEPVTDTPWFDVMPGKAIQHAEVASPVAKPGQN